MQLHHLISLGAMPTILAVITVAIFTILNIRSPRIRNMPVHDRSNSWESYVTHRMREMIGQDADLARKAALLKFADE